MRVLLSTALRRPSRVLQRFAGDPPLLLHDATVVDAAGARDRHDVLIVGDRIAAVGSGLGLRDESGRRLDLSGKTIVPGLIDPWVSLGQAGGDDSAFAVASTIAEMLRWGTTTVHAVGLDCETGYALRLGVVEGLVAGPRFVFGGRPLDVEGFWDRDDTGAPTWSESSADSFRVAARRTLGRGADLLIVKSAGRREGGHAARMAWQIANDLQRPVLSWYTDDRLEFGPIWSGRARPAATGRGVAPRVDAWLRDGTPPSVAVKAATVEPARAFGMDHHVGSIEAGKLAEVVIVDTPRSATAGFFDHQPSMVIHAHAWAPWTDFPE